MRILNCILEERFGGPHRRSFTVAEELRKHGVETVFLIGCKESQNAGFDGFPCYSIRHSQCARRRHCVTAFLLFAFFLPYNIYWIHKIIERHRIDLIHVNGLLNIVPPLVAKLRRKPVVWHCNDGVYPRVIVKLLTPLVLLLSDRSVVQGKRIGRRLFGERTGVWEKLEVVYPAINDKKFSRETVDVSKVQQLSERFDLRSDDICIGTIGNVNRCKGLEHFIRAAALIRDRVPNAKFLVAGSRLDTQEDYWRELQQLISELRLGDHVVFLGFTDAVPEFLSMLQVFVLSSVRESCPNVVLEAMAMGVPVVATDVGSVSELVGTQDSETLVPSGSHEAIADGVLRLFDKPKAEIDGIVCRLRDRAARVFGVDRVCRQQKRIYEELCSPMRGRSGVVEDLSASE